MTATRNASIRTPAGLRWLATGLLLAALTVALAGCGSTKVYTADKTITYNGALYNMAIVQRLGPTKPRARSLRHQAKRLGRIAAVLDRQNRQALHRQNRPCQGRAGINMRHRLSPVAGPSEPQLGFQPVNGATQCPLPALFACQPPPSCP